MLSPITTPNNIIIVGIVVYNLFYLPKNSDLRQPQERFALSTISFTYLKTATSFRFLSWSFAFHIAEISYTNIKIIRSKRIIFHLLIK